jgi:hypothetical protein
VTTRNPQSAQLVTALASTTGPVSSPAQQEGAMEAVMTSETPLANASAANHASHNPT